MYTDLIEHLNKAIKSTNSAKSILLAKYNVKWISDNKLIDLNIISIMDLNTLREIDEALLMQSAARSELVNAEEMAG
ncbi:hypothetical protein PSEHALCIP103_01542 [Pseudoalteromonas haloplanktis]|uniref:Uncharacterized protein n=1 Tax=Pseudoalteromonas haloplanktis TaxID=228 RepID=A0A9W4QWV9_PSEHA|nr:hypothetical protein PSEHALCIP103_01542 [Pseudoalteromonas haloplanktis]